MKVNYKFEFQITLSKISFNLNDSVDIEISNFEKLSSVREISDDIQSLRNLYFTYYGINLSILKVTDLNKQDLSFLSFLEDVSRFNFSDVKFDGDFVPVVVYPGDGYEFILYVYEG